MHTEADLRRDARHSRAAAGGRRGTVVPEAEGAPSRPDRPEAYLDVLLPLLGVLLLVLGLVDALWTSLWLSGRAGPLSARATTGAWRVARAIAGQRHGALSAVGPIIVLAIVALWVLLLWAGWVLVFAADEGSIVDSGSGTPAGWVGRIYFVGFSLFTLGIGDLVPRGDLWRILTVLASGSGMLVVTLAVTYVLSVVSAVVGKRSLSSQVTGLGESAEEIVRHAWNGRDLRALDLPLSALSTQLDRLAEQYRAYPVLEYYHAESAEKSPAVQIATLDEALTILCHGVREECRPNPVVLRSVRAGVRGLLDTLEPGFIDPAAEAPPPPDLARLRGHGIPTVEDERFLDALDGLRDRRRRLLGWVRDDAREWPGR